MITSVILKAIVKTREERGDWRGVTVNLPSFLYRELYDEVCAVMGYPARNHGCHPFVTTFSLCGVTFMDAQDGT